jgi:acyl dehydratase
VIKEYPTSVHRLTVARCTAYAAATQDPNPYYTHPTVAVAPPLSVVMLSLPHAVLQVMQDSHVIADPTVLLRAVHIEECITWHSPLVPERSYELSPSLLSVEQTAAGTLYEIGTVLRHAAQTVCEVKSGILIRQRRQELKNSSGRAARSASRSAEPAWEPAWQRTLCVTEDQSERYAAASGDHNPIHLDADLARQVGLKDRILQGLCTLALAQGALVEAVAQKDVRRLQHLRVHFSHPVYMGESLVCVGDVPASGEPAHFMVHNANGITVLSRGMAKFTPN